MKLEVGKYYKNRKGEKVGPLKDCQHFQPDEPKLGVPFYNLDGQCIGPHNLDSEEGFWNSIIEEWIEPEAPKLPESVSNPHPRNEARWSDCHHINRLIERAAHLEERVKGLENLLITFRAGN